jgi:hypothetical protein
VSLHDSAQESCLNTSIRAVLDRFAARPIDGALISELADALNQDLVVFRAGQRIALALEGSAIRVELTPEWALGAAPGECAAALTAVATQ